MARAAVVRSADCERIDPEWISQPSQLMQITINGQSREVVDQLTVAELLQHLDVSARHVAVEVNQELVPRGRHPEFRLSAGDRLEVVTLVGGG